ncbi:hypothetical protein EMIT048CA2_70265 [Pseudomonas chlororaphis]
MRPGRSRHRSRRAGTPAPARPVSLKSDGPSGPIAAFGSGYRSYPRPLPRSPSATDCR